MKTYFLFFWGDPRQYLDPLQLMGSIQIVSVSDGLYCISFAPPHFEQTILNALHHTTPSVCLVRASLPIFPEPPKTVLAEIDRMIAEADDNSVGFSGR